MDLGVRTLRPGLGVVPVPSPTLPPATHTNAWILGDKEVLVIDPAGIDASARDMLADSVQDRIVTGIFLTHHHGDHIGGAQDLRSRTGAPILAHTRTAAQLPFPVDILHSDGDSIETDVESWTVLHTPGHASGHLCLLASDGHLIAGDMVAGVGTIVLDPPEGHLGDYIRSLTRLVSLKPATLLPAHGPEITPGVPYLNHYIAHRNLRTKQILQALHAWNAPAKPIDLVPLVYPDIPQFVHPLAARQVRCHLQWLCENDTIHETNELFTMETP